MKASRRFNTINRQTYPQALLAVGVVSLLLVLGSWVAGQSSWRWLLNPAGSVSIAGRNTQSGAQWQPNQPAHPICSDTCFKAKDGVCDEGRNVALGAPAVTVSCDLGSDCSDCGAWGGHVPRWPGPGTGPVEFAISRNATVMLKHTSTSPSYLMPITIKERDPDVSAMLDNYGAMEGGVTRVVYEILGNGQCLLKGKRGLVLDVGANFGYFALYAAAMGCRVIAWEPVDVFSAFLHYGIALNNLTHLVSVRRLAVSDNLNEVSIGVPKDGTYWGLASVDNLNLMPREVKEVVQVPAERLDVSVSEPVLLLKVDVEGYEPQIMASATKLIDSKRLAHVLLEYSPGIFERSRDFAGLHQLPVSLKQLLQKGFAAGHLPMRIATPWPPKTMPEHYGSPVPLLEEVTVASLDLDIKAAKMRLQEGPDGKECPIPQELKKFPVWASCREWAYAAHPKGFRSSFGFNTNLWLSRHFKREPSGQATPSSEGGGTALSALPQGTLRLSGQASLVTPSQDFKVWASERNPGQSIGFMSCEGLGSLHKLIFRCPCMQQSDCGEEQKVIEQLLSEGRMPMQGW